MTQKTQRNNTVLGASSIAIIGFAAWCATAHAARVETTLIAREGLALPGTSNAPVVQLKSPANNELADLFLAGTLTAKGIEYGFVWTPPDVILFHGTSVPGGAVVSGRPAASNANEWLVRIATPSARQMMSGHGAVATHGDIVVGATADHQIEDTADPTMTADGTGFFRVKLRNLDAGGVRWAVLRVEDGGAGAVELEIDPGDIVDGYPLTRDGVWGFGVSPNGVHKVLSADLNDGGTKRNSLVINGRVAAMRGDPSGRAGEYWRRFDSPSVGFDGSYLGPAQVKSGPSYFDVLAYTPSNAPMNPQPRILLAEDDCVGTAGAPSPCVTLQGGGGFRSAALDHPSPGTTDAFAYVWVNPMVGPDAEAEYLFYACAAAEATSSYLLLQRGDWLDLDGDGDEEALVNLVGLGGFPEIAFGDSRLYVGAELIIDGEGRHAILGLAKPGCDGFDG